MLLFLEPYISTFQDAISPKAIELFQTIFHVSFLFLSLHSLSIFFFFFFFFFAITWNFNVAVNLLTTFPRQEPLKSKNKKIRLFGIQSFTILQTLGSKRIKTVNWFLGFNIIKWPKVTTADQECLSSFTIRLTRVRISQYHKFSQNSRFSTKKILCQLPVRLPKNKWRTS